MRHKRISDSRASSEYKALGRAVRELRARLCISQEELGYRSRMHRNYVGAIERGEINPTFDSILRLLYGLNITLDELVLAYNRHYRAAATQVSY